MNQQNSTGGASLFSLLAAGLTLAAAVFASGCGRDSANEQMTNARTTPLPQSSRPASEELLTGEAAKGDWTTDAPGVRRKITAADMPAPFATESVKNQPSKVSPPSGAMPQVPPGFQVVRFAEKLAKPRMIRTAPNGDLFVAESEENRIRVLRDVDGDGRPEFNEVFASGAEGLDKPFGIAFHPAGANPQYIYVANTGSVVLHGGSISVGIPKFAVRRRTWFMESRAAHRLQSDLSADARRAGDGRIRGFYDRLCHA